MPALRFGRTVPSLSLKYRAVSPLSGEYKSDLTAMVERSMPSPHQPAPHAGPAASRRTASARWPHRRAYAALDLGTNNCRLLIAKPEGDGFVVIDAFSRIVRLGEGLAATGRLSDAAIEIGRAHV